MPSDSRHVAAVCMIMSAACYAFVPLVMELSGGGSGPFVFNGVVIVLRLVIQIVVLYLVARAAFGVSSSVPGVLRCLFLGVCRGGWGRCSGVCGELLERCRGDVGWCGERGVWRSVAPLVRCAADVGGSGSLFVWAVLGWFQFGLYFWATRYVETAVSATLYELWMIIMVVALAKTAVSGSGREGAAGPGGVRRRLERRELLWMSVALAGVVLVVLSQHGSSGGSGGVGWAGRGLGIVLSLGSAGSAAALGIAGFVLGAYIHRLTTVLATVGALCSDRLPGCLSDANRTYRDRCGRTLAPLI